MCNDTGLTITERALDVIQILTTSDIKMPADKRLEEIYKTAHAVRGTCGNSHNDWIKEIESAHKAFKIMGLL